jgi:hypothetical protein
MSDFLKKVRRVFIEDDPHAAKKAPAPSPLQTPQPSAVPTMPVEPGTTDPTAKGRFVDMLWGVLQQNNKPGFDYFEFQASLQSLADIHLDEPMRYKSALAVARPLGALPEQLIQSANQYLQILDLERQKFEEAAQRQYQQQIQGQQTQVETLDQQVAQKMTEIDRLTQQIERLRDEIEQLKAKKNQMAGVLSDTENKIKNTSAAFLEAHQLVTNKIKNDIESMKRYF